MAYHDPVYISYTLANSAIDTSGVKLRFTGPEGKRGRVVSVSSVLTADTTVAASIVSVGTVADTDAYATLSVPVATAPAAANAATLLTTDANLIPADSVSVIASDGGSTAGDADLSVTVAWF